MTDSEKNRAVPVSREVLDELQRDAARYRWLRMNDDFMQKALNEAMFEPDLEIWAAELDAAIDAAMERK